MVFGNIEDIYIFQKRFAAELDSAVNRSAVSSTELGKIFLKYVSWFYTSIVSRTVHIVMVCVRRTKSFYEPNSLKFLFDLLAPLD